MENNYNNGRPQQFNGNQPNYGYGNPPQQQRPFVQEEYRPLGMWEYFGYQLLYAIPIVGFIFLLIHAFGGTKNINLRNFARSYFCVFIIFFVIILIVATSGAFSYL